MVDKLISMSTYIAQKFIDMGHGDIIYAGTEFVLTNSTSDLQSYTSKKSKVILVKEFVENNPELFKKKKDRAYVNDLDKELDEIQIDFTNKIKGIRAKYFKDPDGLIIVAKTAEHKHAITFVIDLGEVKEPETGTAE